MGKSQEISLLCSANLPRLWRNTQSGNNEADLSPPNYAGNSDIGQVAITRWGCSSLAWILLCARIRMGDQSWERKVWVRYRPSETELPWLSTWVIAGKKTRKLGCVRELIPSSQQPIPLIRHRSRCGSKRLSGLRFCVSSMMLDLLFEQGCFHFWVCARDLAITENGKGQASHAMQYLFPNHNEEHESQEFERTYERWTWYPASSPRISVVQELDQQSTAP